MTTKTNAGDEVPMEMVQRIVRAHLGDPAAQVTDLQADPMIVGGSSSNNPFWRLQASWAGRDGNGSANWVLKQWRRRWAAAEFGVAAPIEALAWQHSLSRPEAMPAGWLSPFVGVEMAANGSEAWIMMENLAEEMQRFTAAQTPDERLARTKLLLDRLARFHTHWEQPERLARVRSYSWLLPQEGRLCMFSRFHNYVLGRTPLPDPSWLDDPYVQGMIQGARAFMAWLPPHVRAQWQRHLCDRDAVVRAFEGLPQTFSQGDPNSRNAGFRWHNGETALLLVDWEMAGMASPAVDVAQTIRDTRHPEWLPELSVYYLERYAAYGGRPPAADVWDRAIGCFYADMDLAVFSILGGAQLLKGDEESVRRRYDSVIELLHRWLF
jgi:hypothetical protein